MYFDKINRNAIFKDTLKGACIFFIMSTLNEIYNESNDLVRVFAFLWAVPTLYFFFINMFSRRGESAIHEFNKHALLGLFLTLIAILFTTMCLNSCRVNTIIFGNFSFLIICVSLYLYLGLYKKGMI